MPRTKNSWTEQLYTKKFNTNIFFRRHWSDRHFRGISVPSGINFKAPIRCNLGLNRVAFLFSAFNCGSNNRQTPKWISSNIEAKTAGTKW